MMVYVASVTLCDPGPELELGTGIPDVFVTENGIGMEKILVRVFMIDG